MTKDPMLDMQVTAPIPIFYVEGCKYPESCGKTKTIRAIDREIRCTDFGGQGYPDSWEKTYEVPQAATFTVMKVLYYNNSPFNPDHRRVVLKDNNGLLSIFGVPPGNKTFLEDGICGRFGRNDVHVAKTPEYLKNESNYVQKLYYQVALGSTSLKKCKYLEISTQEDYETRFENATKIFESYVLDNKFATDPYKASRYAKAVARAGSKKAAMSMCDSIAKERVSAGFDTATNFMSLVEHEPKTEEQ